MRLRLSTDLTLTTSAFIGPLNDGEIEDIPVVISNSTAITLNSFKAYQIGNSVYLNWDTGYEADNLGFNLYRESGGRRHLVSRSLIAGSGLMVGKGVRLQAGYPTPGKTKRLTLPPAPNTGSKRSTSTAPLSCMDPSVLSPAKCFRPKSGGF